MTTLPLNLGAAASAPSPAALGPRPADAAGTHTSAAREGEAHAAEEMTAGAGLTGPSPLGESRSVLSDPWFRVPASADAEGDRRPPDDQRSSEHPSFPTQEGSVVFRIAFTVLGDPAPQGSKRARPIYKGRGVARVFTGKVAQVESSKALKPWRALVASAAADAMGERPVWDCAVAMDVTFLLPLPMTAPKSWRHHAKWHLPWRRPDLDKLLRGLFDAMSGVCFREDSRVVQVTARKVYADGTGARRSPGAFVICWQVDPADVPLGEGITLRLEATP